MTNNLAFKHWTNSAFSGNTLTNCTIGMSRSTKPHAIYDGCVFVIWAIGFLLAAKTFLTICKGIKTLIEIK